MRLAIVGIRGIPNNYGGFETLTEYLVEYLAKELEITVYCSSKDMPSKMKEYKGAKLSYIPITSHGALGIIYDSLCLLSAIRKHDKILFLGFGGGFTMPFLKKYWHKIILNIGGLDWKRDKWNSTAQTVIKKSESLLIRHSDRIISDNIGIKNYILEEYGRSSEFIPYGGDQAQKLPVTAHYIKKYPFLKSKYAFIVTRIQPDNNIVMLLEAFRNQTKLPLVIVGNWNSSQFGKETKKKYSNNPNIILLDAIYNRSKLDVLRSNCTIYLHGHSAGGTNPSLCEAMYLELPVFAFASGYNENTTFNKAKYFKDENELLQLVYNYESFDIARIKKDLKEIADKHYRWSQIAEEYKKVILKNNRYA